ncbi:MAG TPA: SIMPL domain-containing protein [Terracidiphilus sp.]|nr:SIMPL domain-containing protein [Terracidiphilus sp.]
MRIALRLNQTLPLAAALSLAIPAPVSIFAQQPGQPALAIGVSNRTLSVSATATVSVEPDLAIVHIGFQTQPESAKQAYADGARTSNAILGAVKQAGIPDADIRSESQYLQPDYAPKSHKFILNQQWTVRTPPARAAEILDLAITAGANNSGQIEWTVKDQHALATQALDKAAQRAREDAATLAHGMNVHLGPLVYVSNQLSSINLPRPMMVSRLFAADKAKAAPPLAVEPNKVTREATVYAVFAIE